MSPKPPETALWLAVMLLFLFGGAGGLVNAILTAQGWEMPRFDRLPTGGRIFSPLGAVPIGDVFGATLPLNFANLASALGIGIGGARLLTSEIDKRYEALARNELGSVVAQQAKQLTGEDR
jgi:hypothetical protein